MEALIAGCLHRPGKDGTARATDAIRDCRESAREVSTMGTMGTMGTMAPGTNLAPSPPPTS